ncbi:MAG: GDP-mannose 4,6-dehydratase [Alphaproteobacteria bacterium]|nr:GDP-mannose 4,6-dehydratase [Alphaproteobacteria bacterium]
MVARKTAFITGIAGQDGAFLARFLLEKGYAVHGLIRWDSYPDPLNGLQRLDTLGLVSEEIALHTGDLTDANNVTGLIRHICPDEIYNLAALSHVKVSFDTPASALDINVKGTLNVLDAVRVLGWERDVRIYQASSSEMFGSSQPPQNEQTPMEPCSPYGAAKLAAYHLAKIYRDSYGMHISNGILFNHESALRGEDFVTRKITKAVAVIEAGGAEPLTLGNLDAVRDWGHVRDYVEGMWLMLRQNVPGDYVLATGEARSVRDFVEQAFAHIGVKLKWSGRGAEETALDAKTGRLLVRVDPALFRPKEVHALLGDASKAREVLGWRPKIRFEALVADLLNADRQLLRARGEVSWPQRMAG